MRNPVDGDICRALGDNTLPEYRSTLGFDEKFVDILNSVFLATDAIDIEVGNYMTFFAKI